MKPKYAEVYESLVERIADMDHGERLESEAKLASSYNVAPMTVRRALMLLSQEGRTVGKPGRGTFVVKRPDSPQGSGREGGANDDLLTGSGAPVRSSGRGLRLPPVSTVRLRSATIEAADKGARAQLGVDEGVFVVRLVLHHAEDGEVIGIERCLLDAEHFPGFLGQAIADALPEHLLRAYPGRIRDTHARVFAELLNAEDAATLGVDEPCAGLCIETRQRADDGRVVAVSGMIYRADRAELTM